MVKVICFVILFFGCSWVSAATMDTESASSQTSLNPNLTAELKNLKPTDTPEEVILDVSGVIQTKSQLSLPSSESAPKNPEPLQQEIETLEEKPNDLDAVKLEINMAPISPTDLQLLNSFIYFKPSRTNHNPNEQI